ncbi:hypothetical protein LEP1GSC193_0317 [Leptospira alstonii serovar Pingchang str. 80-412]|uniref:Uncharacterized protein n=1 Tax=Leptospira alstonii serovar Pingchang str. 80-412 TaxID=1218564 RepID=T0H7D1_9LEPT|nr:hypothetical protein LEP1GSC193_0317 [Leptospira alstonii serovar Pingchang str. 80-412]
MSSSKQFPGIQKVDWNEIRNKTSKPQEIHKAKRNIFEHPYEGESDIHNFLKIKEKSQL